MNTRSCPARVHLALLAAIAAACTPDVGDDPVPEALEFEPEAAPPRVPQPTGLLVNPQTGRIDFGFAGSPLPPDCSAPGALSEAECRFNRYLETLDGFPTVTPASAPATAQLDPGTFRLGSNVVVAATRDAASVPALALGFDGDDNRLTLRPAPSWSIGEMYWIGVRGYTNGVRARSGAEVVGSPTHALLKQDSPLTCGASTPDELDPECPAFALLARERTAAEAAQALFTLEAIRGSYVQLGVWQRLAAAGLPKDEAALVWGFPIHTASVAEIDPAAGLVPRSSGANQIRIAVHGPVDPETVRSFVVREREGSVVVMNLTAAASGDLVAGFPRVEASYSEGDLVITGGAPFGADQQYAVFVTNEVRNPSGVPLVPAPISVLLASPAPLVDAAGASLLSTLSDADASSLEGGRSALSTLFDDPVFSALTGVERGNLAYCFAFTFGELP